MRIHVTGGAGFIGTHVVNKLLTLGHDVVVVDCFDAQVHGDSWSVRSGLRTISLSSGSIRPDLYDGCDVLIHLGAKVGVGQSMYDIDGYVGGNSFDTARMLRKLSERKPKRLVVASSMSIYGEGAYLFDQEDPQTERFEMGSPAPTLETKSPDLRSIYALTKYDQEQLCLIWGRAYDVPTVALRFFNTYGPGQSLNNPYTGVLAIFASRLLNNKPPVIYEDGQQSRDFIHVDDVANAVVHAALNDIPSGPYNVGTGVATSIKRVAQCMKATLDPSGDVVPVITGQHRKGDIRHCFADIGKIQATGWTPQISFDKGLAEYCQWLLTQPIPEDKFEQAHQELIEKGLTK